MACLQGNDNAGSLAKHRCMHGGHTSLSSVPVSMDLSVFLPVEAKKQHFPPFVSF